MQARRKPIQGRSKEKVEGILDAAKQLIGERGNDAVSMREIAAFAGVAPSSIYQYFPDKNALLEQLMAGYYARIHALIVTGTEMVKTVADLTDALNRGIDQFYQLFKTEPVLATIWAGVQANTVLREMDERDSVRNAEYVTAALKTLVPELNEQEACIAFVLLMDMAGLTVRQALAKGEVQGGLLVEEYKLLLKMRIERLVSSQEELPACAILIKR